MVIRPQIARIFNPRTGGYVGDNDAPTPKETTSQFIARVKATMKALGIEPRAAHGPKRTVVPPGSRVVSKDEHGPTHPAIKAHPQYKEARERGFAMVARDVGFHDGLQEAQSLRPKREERHPQ